MRYRSGVFPAERRHQILELVRANGAISLREIAARTNTSEVTVRRDVRALQAEGLIDRRHGGAMVPGRLGGGPSTATPATANSLAALAARMVAPGDAIVLGAGRHIEELARALVAVSPLVVVTNSLTVAQELAGSNGIELMLTAAS